MGLVVKVGDGAKPTKLLAKALTVLLIVLVAIPQFGIVERAIAQTSNQLGEGDLNCGHFLERAHAEAVFDISNVASDPDPYGLDGSEGAAFDGEQDVPCEDPDLFGSEDIPANCTHFLPESEGGQEHAQALYNASNGGEGYNLAAVDGVACAGGEAEIPSDLPPADPAPVDLPPPATIPESAGCDVEIQAGRAYVITDCYDGTVEAGFLPFEGFDTFAARAQNGFGAFDGSDGGAPIVIEVQQSAPAGDAPRGRVSQGAVDNATRVVETEQTVRKAKKKKATKRAKQGKQAKEKKAKRAKARKAERARLRRQS